MSGIIYDFDEELARSKAVLRESDEATLRQFFVNCQTVQKTTEEEDRNGVDYRVTLRPGAQLRVDAKNRKAGCSRYWTRGPEMALELWNVMPGGKFQTPRERKKIGWTMDESKEIDLILFTFHPSDHPFAYVRSFPLLREAFRRWQMRWHQQFKTDIQESQRTDRWGGISRWESECIFVPLNIIDQAMTEVSQAQGAA